MSANPNTIPRAYPYSNHQASLNGQRHADPEDLVLHAMQFLSGEEATSLTRHVEHCPECQRELALVLRDLAVYAITIDLQPAPPHARQRVRTQVARENRHVAVVQPALASFGRNGSILTAAEDEQPGRNPALVFLCILGWIAAAGLAVAAAMLYKETGDQRAHLNVQSSENAQLTVEADRAHQLMNALGGANAVGFTLTVKPPANAQPLGRVLYDPTGGNLVFLANDLTPLQANKAYEIWLIPADGSAAIPAAVFHPDLHGNASVVLPSVPHGVAARSFGVSIEDEGGAQTPTLPYVMAGGQVSAGG